MSENFLSESCGIPLLQRDVVVMIVW